MLEYKKKEVFTASVRDWDVLELNAGHNYQPLTLSVDVNSQGTMSSDYDIQWHLPSQLVSTNSISSHSQQDHSYSVDVLVPPFKGEYVYSVTVRRRSSGQVQTVRGTVRVGEYPPLDNLHQLPTSPVDLSQYKVDFVVKFSAISEVGLEKAWKQYLDKVSSLPTFHASINSFPHLQSNSFKNDRVRLSSDNSSPLRSVVGIEHGLERVYQLGDKQIVFPIDITVASAPTAESVSIIGNAEVGQTLRGSYTFDDANGDKEGASTFQWYRGNTKISGATQKTYTLTATELGEAIKFEVTPVSVTGAPTTLIGVAVQSSATTPVVAAPAAPAAPTVTNVLISGNAEVGQTLRGSYTFGDANGDKEGASTFQWYRGNTKISGATQKSYTLTATELGEAIKFEVTPVSATGTPTTLTGVAVQSSATTPVVAAPAAPTVTNVLISGNAEVGQTLRGSYTFDDANGDREGVSTFQWYRGNTKISGATQKS
ncbi:hypothetical protein, partial [Vibrio mediterranei]|uniref:hypothetical protein n=1 Tax=Vibrio mediterranei TaxID=689 RepID=UPI002284CDD4